MKDCEKITKNKAIDLLISGQYIGCYFVPKRNGLILKIGTYKPGAWGMETITLTCNIPNISGFINELIRKTKQITKKRVKSAVDHL